MCEYCEKVSHNKALRTTYDDLKPGVELFKSYYDGWLIDVEVDVINDLSSYRESIEIPINYCPMCGRKLDI